MIRDYLGEAGSGRLQTQRFILLWLSLMIAFIAFGLLFGAGIGIAERLIGGDLQAAQQLLIETVGLPAVVGIAVVLLVFAFAKLNIMAKRARDIGLPGWLTAVILAGLIGGSTQAIGPNASGGLGMVLLIVLAFVPTDALARRS